MAKKEAKVLLLDPHDVVIIGLDTEDGPEHPLWVPRAATPVDKNLAKNISVYGVLQPILVRQEAGKYLVVVGRRRVKAAREAAKLQETAGEHNVKVPALLKIADDTRIQGVMITENAQRTDDTVLDKAIMAARVLDMKGSIDEVAVAFGVKPITIKNWLLLVQADPRVQAAVRAEKISARRGIEIGGLDRKEQKKALEASIRAQERGESLSMKTLVQDSGKGGGSKKIKASAKPVNVGGAQPQRGIKRSWMRTALKTERAKALSDEQRDVLCWFATGESEKGTWFDEFTFEAEAEMEKLAEDRVEAKQSRALAKVAKIEKAAARAKAKATKAAAKAEAAKAKAAGAAAP